MGMKVSGIFLTCGLAIGSLTTPVHGQSLGKILGDTVERTVRDELKRKAAKETRRVTRCALGDTGCVDGSTDAQDVSKVGEPDASSVNTGFVLTPYPGSVPITSSPRNNRVEAFTEYERITASSGQSMSRNDRKTERLEGRLTVSELRNPGGRSTFEIERNYLDALRGSGFVVDFSCNGNRECGWPAYGRNWGEINGLSVGAASDVRYFTGSAMGETGEVYVSVAIVPRSHFIHILETAEMDAGLVSVAGIAASLDRDGRVELNGVFFDTGRASLRPESEATLAEVAELLQTRPTLRLNVVGHTDNTGDFNANRSLSQARAEAVRAALVGRYGVDGPRLTAIGQGSTAPVAANETEDGRARNRRVELVRQ